VAEGTRSRGVSEKKRVKRRRAQGAAVAALNAFTADHDADARKTLGLAAPDEAIRELTAVVDDDDLHVPRLFVLDSLVKLASRGEDLQSHGEAVDRLLKGLVRRAGVPDEEVADATATARAALDEVDRRTSHGEAVRAWSLFAKKAAGALRLTRAEAEKPLCNDAEAVQKSGCRARGVTVEFHTDATPGDMRRFCDPTRWHEVSAFQHEMTPWKGPGSVSLELPNGGWCRDLIEEVELTPAKTLVTPLRFTYLQENEADPDWVHLDYVLIEKTEDIGVDEGSLDLRRVGSGRHRGRTRVSAKKAIFFSDQMFQDWTSIACDTFWTDTVIAAAVDSATGSGTPPT
jgi:hypothetical protein